MWIIHFPRDLYVPIPGHGEGKINAAYAYGQSPLLVETIQDLVGVKIDHVAKTDFEGFKNLTDALGGVTVTNQHASPEYPAGQLELDGDEALAYVRERKTLAEGDISRGQRQQAWLKAMMAETLSPGVLLNPSKLGDVIEAGTSNTVVDNDLTTGRIRSETWSGPVNATSAPRSAASSHRVRRMAARSVGVGVSACSAASAGAGRSRARRARDARPNSSRPLMTAARTSSR